MFLLLLPHAKARDHYLEAASAPEITLQLLTTTQFESHLKVKESDFLCRWISYPLDTSGGPYVLQAHPNHAGNLSWHTAKGLPHQKQV